MKKYVPTYENVIIKKIDDGYNTCFILKTTDEPDYWYWVVDTKDVKNYRGSDKKFVNDMDNGTLGFSCASFDTADAAERDYLSQS